MGVAAGSGFSSCLGSFRPLIPEAGAGFWPAALPEFARGPKYATEQIEDGLVLVFSCRDGLGVGMDPPPTYPLPSPHPLPGTLPTFC